MKDQSQTKQELIKEISVLKQRIQDSDQIRAELKRAETESKEKDKFLEAMVQSSAVATFVVDAGHKIVFWNKACEDLTGINAQGLLGTSNHWKAFYDHPRPCVADLIIDNKYDEMANHYGVYARSILIPDGIRAEGWYPNLGGKSRYILFDAAPIRNNKGEIIAAIETLQDITDRKQAEQVIQEERNLSESIINGLPGIFYLFDSKGKFLRWNRNFEIVSEYSHEEILARHPSDFFAGKESELVQQRIQDTFANGEANVEAHFISRSGSAVPYFLTGVRIEINGQLHLMGMGMNISERKRTEEALLESEERFRTLSEKTPLGMSLIGNDGQYEYINPAFVKIFGYDLSDIPTGKEWFSKAYPDLEYRREVMADWKEDLGRYLNLAVRPRTYEVKCKGGSFKTILFRPVTLPSGKQFIIYEDITEQKRMEDELRMSEKRYRSLYNNTPVMLHSIDAHGNLISVSEYWLTSLGYTRDEVIGRKSSELLTEVSRKYAIETVLPEFRKTGFCSNIEYRFVKKNGEVIDTLLSAISERDESGMMVRSLAVVTDITDRKLSEKTLKDTLESLRKAVGTTIQVMVSAVESRDPYTAGHQIRSADLARAIAMEMELPQDKIDAVRMAGSIHDIGKLSIPAEILSKPTKLSEIEFSLIKEHAQKGFDMLKDVQSPWPLADIVYQHHERMDGSGYPRNLRGEEICIEARILSVADVVEAMASHRPYRAGLGINTALEEVEKNKGVSYDSAVADACLRLFREKGFKLESHDYKH